MAEKKADVEMIHDMGEATVGKKDGQILIDPELEKRVLRKVDWNLVPIFLVLQLCAFLDRINIGNARIQGLEKDLNMHGTDINIALFLFFIPYILLEVPSNVLLKKLRRPSIFIGCIVISWSICVIGQGVTASFAGLTVCRVLIGIFEAGLFPGQIYIMSMYYRRHELQWRVAFLFCGCVISGAFSGLLAYAIAHMEGVAGYASWRWIFILEGIGSVLIGVMALWLVPDWPENARFLTEEERLIVVQRVATDRRDVSMNHWNKKTAIRVFTDAKIYLGVLMYLGTVTTSYAGAFFIPTIVKQLGWTAVKAQLMSIPIWTCAMLSTLTTCYLSDRLRHRYGFIVVGACVSTLGYVILLKMHSVAVGVRYFAIFFCFSGAFIVQPVTVVWLSNNVAGHYKAGISSAMQIGLGNIGGIVASLMFVSTQAPEYPLGYGLGLGLQWVCVVAATIFFFLLRRENKIRDNGGRDDRYNLPDAERNNLGDDHPAFRFTY
ncbi:hypothetical protein H2200_000990 [Cladophialophora chaetospira]|uniref:Major facilitator superfamily (MFS) profile domain-containing protein n=1 Tax=Cladophialophora chaetospira TaxID=386627 RepID=A0AA38XPL3_9EURO|nr:hypothetical protein H2200_000990 [Cladophialophora chaetospira]